MRSLWLVALLLSVAAFAAEPTLTLEEALHQADALHPDLEQVRAQAEAATADTQLAESLNDFRLTLEAGLKTGRNPLYQNNFHSDNMLRLDARKTLFDAGRQSADVAAARDESVARGLQLMDARAQRRIAIMARYFDALLTDMQYNAESEFMAVAYTSWDHARDRNAVGQVAQWELAELEARYQDSVQRRNDTRRKLREKRQLLASALNQPGPLTAELVDPVLKGNEQRLPEFEPLLDDLMKNNPRLTAQQRLLAAAGQRIEAQRVAQRPSLELEAESAKWSRDATTRDDLRVGLNFVWPLWQGGRQEAGMAREQARFHAEQAQYERLRMDLRQALLETREEIEYLRDTARRDAEINANWRDLALEKARAEYELELRTTLGTGMAETQMAKLRRRAVEYSLALAWARLENLLAGPVEAVKEDRK